VRAGLEAEVAPEPVVVDAEPVLDAAPLAPPKLEPVVTRAVVPDAAVPVAVARPELAPPQLGLVRTRWHPRPERREALVVVDDAEQMVREGDETLGYAVIEITPSSIVFGREGDTVRVRVGTH
jgi:hypothetical protein